MSGERPFLVHSLSRPVAIRGKRHSFSFMSFLTVVEARDALLVFDTGLDADGGLEKHFHCLGLDPASVSHVFLTHLHIDHFGGNALFPRAKKVMSRGELEYQMEWNEEFMRSKDRAGFLRSRFPRLAAGESEKLADMLGAGHAEHFSGERIGNPDTFLFVEDGPVLPAGVRPVPSPGHTPHHLAYLVEAAGGGASGGARAGGRGGVSEGAGALIVTGDLFAGRRRFFGEENGFLEVYSSEDEAARSLAKVRELGSRFSDAAICPAHDRPFSLGKGTYYRHKTLVVGGTPAGRPGGDRPEGRSRSFRMGGDPEDADSDGVRPLDGRP